MSDQPKKIKFSDFFTEGQYETQLEKLVVPQKRNKLVIGIPRENGVDESRVSLVPNSIRTLTGYGHTVMVESGAGEKSNYTDHDYSEAGAIIAYSQEEIYKSQMLIKTSTPTLKELEYLQMEQILISPLQIPTLTHKYIQTLLEKRTIAFAMEYLQSDDGTFPIVRIMSEMAGMCAMLTAAELLTNTKGGRGVLLGGVTGVPPAKVVILGGGVVGEFATKTALGLGASVRIFDNDISKLMRLQSMVGRQLHTSTINPVYLAYQLMSADVVIGAIHSQHGRTPVIVTEEMVSKMKEGAVIIDISIDQGGCFETSQMTSHSKPTFIKHGVIHYCVPNISSKISRTASVAVSNIITPLVLKAGEEMNIESLLFNSKGIRNGCYTYKGCLTNEYLSHRFEIKNSNLDLLLTSKL